MRKNDSPLFHKGNIITNNFEMSSIYVETIFLDLDINGSKTTAIFCDLVFIWMIIIVIKCKTFYVTSIKSQCGRSGKMSLNVYYESIFFVSSVSQTLLIWNELLSKNNYYFNQSYYNKRNGIYVCISDPLNYFNVTVNTY